MSVNIKKFMRKEIYDWVYKNTDNEVLNSFPSKEDFWLTPIDEGQPDSKEIIKELIAKFDKTKIEKIRVVDGIGVVVLREGERVIVCGGYLDGMRKVSISNHFSEGLQKTEVSFMQKILVISKLGMTSSRKIGPHVWKNNPIFEDDVKNYFPHLACFEFNKELAAEPADAVILRFLMSVENGCENVKELNDDLVEVMLSIPVENHDWLVQQLLHSVLAGRDSGLYSELYRMVEFFFPLFKVEKLKNNIKYSGNVLSLLDVCMNDLGWHVNHQMGSRLALNYANISFAEIMLGKAYDGSSDDDIKKFKESAMEKMTDLRHSLVHQKFKQIEFDDTDLKRATRSILSFLTGSFSQYSISLQK